ncbi:hypothetical protein GCM10027275_04260 [Rhabdobacter roseus]|uniref:Ferric-dicitrate binding protein FerR (Iron transport regulator) n=1 Tax=Rhabdobacter roseus TaxID=1655419 RepID=A0A840TDW9_9BACT|nr:FecR family protein [Rhabdobacter roseus]MBB5282316.1 ferric-dicitrate binding protein FerR (iron transport regulator) [Rhabdobacter roseus]
MDAYKDLLKKYLEGTCTDQEKALLDDWYRSLEAGLPPADSETEQAALIRQKWQALVQENELLADFPSPAPLRPWWYRSPTRWAAAAVVLLGVGMGWFWLRSPSAFSTLPVALQPWLPSTDSLREETNATNDNAQIVLSDGSTVTLAPRSHIRYADSFGQTERKVYLTGEAFFEVTKNPDKPFFVYANDVVTKVLGTSFRVNAREKGGKVVVTVKTGKVTVFSNELLTNNLRNQDPETTGVVLTPNQQVVYLSQEKRLIKSLIDKPDILIPEERLRMFTFENAPISELFEAIEIAYGVDIVYDEELMKNCSITTSLDGESLHNILEILSKLMNASYKTIDAQIVFQGQGC